MENVTYPDIIALSIPLLVLSVVIEAWVDRKHEPRQFSLNRTMSNMGCGIFEQITGFISKGVFFGVYWLVFDQWRLFNITDGSVWTWVGLILLVDFIFYWFHRACHRMNLLWAGHVIHHEVDEFNLTVALRRSALQEFLIIPVYLPLAVLGFSPGAFFLMFAAHNLYQFYIHTPYAPELRFAGLLLNTPHHHQVHHCRNACYLDKNFAGVFIVWDKLFGTFEPLKEDPEWGVHQKTTTLNPVLAQFATLARVLRRSAQRPGLWLKLKTFVEAPTWLGMEDEASQKLRCYNPQMQPRAKKVAAAFFAAAVVGVTVYRNLEASLGGTMRFLALLGLGLGVYLMGCLLDARPLVGLAPRPKLPAPQNETG